MHVRDTSRGAHVNPKPAAASVVKDLQAHPKRITTTQSGTIYEACLCNLKDTPIKLKY